MGVSCSTPNRLVCDRVGVSVRLVVAASHLRVTVAGRAVTMSSDNGTDWIGFLDPAGLTSRSSPLYVGPFGSPYYGADRPVVSVRVRAEYDRGVTSDATVSADLAPGWG